MTVEQRTRINFIWNPEFHFYSTQFKQNRLHCMQFIRLISTHSNGISTKSDNTAEYIIVDQFGWQNIECNAISSKTKNYSTKYDWICTCVNSFLNIICNSTNRMYCPIALRIMYFAFWTVVEISLSSFDLFSLSVT